MSADDDICYRCYRLKRSSEPVYRRRIPQRLWQGGRSRPGSCEVRWSRSASSGKHMGQSLCRGTKIDEIVNFKDILNSDVLFFFLNVLLRCWECSWHMTLHGFKVYSMMIWHTYITECLSQQVYWTFIISYRCRVKEIESKMFSPVLRTLRICSLNFHVYYTAVFITFITSHIPCLVLLITRSLCLLTAFIPFPLPPSSAWSNHTSDRFFYVCVCLFLKQNDEGS